MPLYIYTKKNSLLRKKIVTLVSFLFIFCGLGIISIVLYPIISFEIIKSPDLNNLIVPIPENNNEKKGGNFTDIFGITTKDYTKASIWFPKTAALPSKIRYNSYFLSIPKISINNALVMINNEDLTKSLIHFTGPEIGSYGNPVIIGHSTLPILYNPNDYKTIFTRLPKLLKNDEIYIYADNVSYKYKIIDMKITTPEDLTVLEQQYDNKYITLITCVPPGTYLKRLIIKGVLTDI
jgi:sortase A